MKRRQSDLTIPIPREYAPSPAVDREATTMVPCPACSSGCSDCSGTHLIVCGVCTIGHIACPNCSACGFCGGAHLVSPERAKEYSA